ncbi:MAG: flagellar export chaperone FliS [Clostridia bacterium]|nr:flagellar export chaperone FliS [Clostridia bacterium]NCC68407.1 flagellar export chaperone FliS [Clostridia bacterium]
MYYKNSYLKQEYLKQSILTANPAELIVMLFDGCIKNLKLAQICLENQRDIAGAGFHLMKAQKIIMELVNCLDTGIEVSEQLIRIYDYLLYAIREMNAKKDLTLMPDVLEILTAFRDTWEQLKTGGFTPAAEVS